MKSVELREAFLKFFEDRGHTRADSAPLVPKRDPTILFNVAGMVQFKPFWAGLVEPLPYKRATSVQKCLRLNDLDVVGTDATHDTFFEMLGNFSFGDYQKEEAIKWAWEFIIQVMKLPTERLWVTVHESDEEAASIWRDIIGLPKERVVPMGDEDNFWGPVGSLGACGPCSEIFWDIKYEGDPGPGPAQDDARYTEIWNLVFPQFDQQESGSRPLLKYRGVDTGAGLERMVMAVQNVETIFHTDLFRPLMEVAADTVGVKNSEETREALAITADHVRAISFVISEGVRPSNTKQGYVVRRLLRRALGSLYPFGIKEPLLYRMSGQIVEQMRHVYPELEDRREQTALMIKGEEERFLRTLESGMRLFEDAASAGKIAGSDAFKLYDTFGFPLDLTKLLAKHKGIEVDLAGFEHAMEAQRKKSRMYVEDIGGKAGAKAKLTYASTKFIGYDKMKVKTKIAASSYDEQSKEVNLQLEESPFYAASGGQVSDTGLIIGKDFEIEVVGTEYNQAGVQVIHGKFAKDKKTGDLKGQMVKAIVDLDRRMEIERSHTATHLLHAALRKILGEHVKQEGSLVEPGRLRFDFYHPSPMTAEEIAEVEKTVYNWIIANHEAKPDEMSRGEAEKLGALAFFGEKYGEEVRVLQIKDKNTGELISAELCGGTHLDRTGDIGMFLITSETGVAAGIRRIEALVGQRAWEQTSHVRSILAEASALVGTEPATVIKRIEELKEALAADSKARERMAQHFVQVLSERVLSEVTTLDDTDFAVAKVEALGREELRLLADALKSKRERIAGLLAAPDKKGRLAALCFSSKPTSKDYPAGEILKAVAAKLKGGGGGSPTLAEGSIAETSLDNLTSVFLEVVKSRREAK